MTSPQPPTGQPPTPTGWQQPSQPYAPPPQQPPVPGGQSTPKRKAPAWLVAVVLILFVAVCGGGLAAILSSGGDPDPVADDNSTGAEVMCEQAVKERLKAPASAEFPKPKVVKTQATYTVTGSVDSQNSFGAMIRTSYVCTITDQGNDKWLLAGVEFPK